jgi:four helix bundle protein
MGNAIYDLEERTLEFAKRITRLCKALPKDQINFEFIKQITRSGSSVGANYREANEALSKKDFLMRAKISRKEAKETIFWLELIIEANKNFKERIIPLLQETIELKKILSKIIENSEKIKNK